MRWWLLNSRPTRPTRGSMLSGEFFLTCFGCRAEKHKNHMLSYRFLQHPFFGSFESIVFQSRVGKIVDGMRLTNTRQGRFVSVQKRQQIGGANLINHYRRSEYRSVYKKKEKKCLRKMDDSCEWDIVFLFGNREAVSYIKCLFIAWCGVPLSDHE